MKLWIRDGNRHEQLASGYGQLAAALAANLERLGHVARFEPFAEMDVCLFVCPPYGVRDAPEVFTAVFTMHEEDTLPPAKSNWPDILNTVDLVLTPTPWNMTAWQKLGVRVPIEVVPLGIDDEVFKPPTGRTCRFLTVHADLGSGSSRENWQDTLHAYYSAFTHSDRVELLIKTWKYKHTGWHIARRQILEELTKDEAELPLVTVLEEKLPPEELSTLYHSAWLFVKNANREGWSLPCSEAVACGATIAATRIQPLISHLPPDTIWFQNRNVEELTSILKKQYRLFLKEEARSRRFTWEKSAKVLVERIEAAKGENVDRRIQVQA